MPTAMAQNWASLYMQFYQETMRNDGYKWHDWGFVISNKHRYQTAARLDLNDPELVLYIQRWLDHDGPADITTRPRMAMPELASTGPGFRPKDVATEGSTKINKRKK